MHRLEGPLWLQLCQAAEDTRKEDRLDDAIRLFNDALRLNLHAIDALESLGQILYERNLYAAALVCLRRCAHLCPDTKRMYNLGLGYRMLARFDEAMEALKAACEISPHKPNVSYKLALVMMDRLDYSGAIQYFKHTLKLNPNDVHSIFDLGFSYLALGDYEKGLQIYEQRKFLSEKKGKPLCVEVGKRWQGEPILNGRLLICWEQGTGDMLQFIRFAKQAKERCGGELVAQAPLDVEELVRTVPGVDKTTAAKVPVGFDYYVPGGSLAHVLGIDIMKMPAEVPYFNVSRERIEEAGKILGHLEEGRTRIGIVWAGKPSFDRDQYRSLPFDKFIEVLDIPDADFVSLQHGKRAQDLQDSGISGLIFDTSPYLKSFADTAALIQHLDLVICCDTSTCHLVGALAKPVWILIEWRADWRWTIGYDDRPRWYPTTRLFRQSQPKEWREPIQRLLKEYRRIYGKKKIRTGRPATQPRQVPSEQREAWSRARSLGLEAHQEGRLPAAVALFNQALAIHPDDVDSLNGLGQIHYDRGEYHKALICLRRCALLHPHRGPIFKLALALTALHRDTEAVAILQAIVEQRPDDAEAHAKLGAILLRGGLLGVAMDHLRQALSFGTKEVRVRHELAHAYLAAGEYQPGWLVHAHALAHEQEAPTDTIWNGETITGTLLIDWRGEVEDLLLFSRFAVVAKRRCGQLIVRAGCEFCDLIATVPGVDATVGPEAEIDYDAQISCSLLPAILNIQRGTEKSLMPYLKIATKKELWAKELLQSVRAERIRIGIAWTRFHDRGSQDSDIPFQDFLHLIAIPETSFVSLQPASSVRDMDESGVAGLVFDANAHWNNYDDLAALISCLDLVICCAGTIAHLAGALGVPVWILSTRPGSWCWQLMDEGIPVWYPSARVFQQRQAGDWRETFTEVERELVAQYLS